MFVRPSLWLPLPLAACLTSEVTGLDDDSADPPTPEETTVTTRPDLPDPDEDDSASPRWLTNAVIAVGERRGAKVDLEIVEGRIVSIGQAPPGAPQQDLAGHWLLPAFIDSHVHLSYYPVAASLPEGGIAAAVDLASPIQSLETNDPDPLAVLRSGPMLTALSGYPTQSWGSDGYGLECADVPCVEAAVAELHAMGAALIKIPRTGGPSLDDAQVAAAVAAAHDRGIRVAAHALSESAALETARLGTDLLAHVPTETMSEENIEAWSQRAAIPTLRAFGSPVAMENLARLHTAGTSILYGTDLGNSRHAGILVDELLLMESAGMSPLSIVASATSIPADYWGLTELGRIEVGARAMFIATELDPLEDLERLRDLRVITLD